MLNNYKLLHDLSNYENPFLIETILICERCNNFIQYAKNNDEISYILKDCDFCFKKLNKIIKKHEKA